MDLSKSLSQAIFNSGLKKKEVAKKLKTSPQQISNWLASGNIKQSSIIEICELFEITASEFIKLGE